MDYKPSVGLEGGGGQGVDGVGADQLLDIENIGVGGILGAGRGPQRPLHPGTARRQRGEVVAAEELGESAVGELGVGDRRPTP